MTKRWQMYSKIQAMKSQGFKQRKVATVLEIHRSTVKKYWDMTPEEFQETILEPAKKSSLEQHKELVLSWLRNYREITAAQVYDWLKEKYGLKLAENSVRRFVRRLRIDYDIKPEGMLRDYQAIPVSTHGASNAGRYWNHNRRKYPNKALSKALLHRICTFTFKI